MSTNPSPASTSPTSPTEINAELSAEIEAAMNQAMKAPAARPAPTTATAPTAGPKPGIRGPRVVQAGREHRTGTVVSVGPSDIFVEFGPKSLGIVPRMQYKDEEVPKVGDIIDVVIDKFEAAESLFVCSKPGSVQKADWELLEAGQVLEAKVTGVSKGGLELEVANHRAFMPASQVAVERIPDLSVFVGERLKCEVVRVERMGSGNIVLSRRNVLERDRKAQAEAMKSKLKEGDTLEGTVRKIMPFGAFVDLGGIDGLIHISDITYDRIGYGEKAIEKHLKEGQKVSVRVLKIDWDNERIGLGLKQLSTDPFQTAAASITEGAELTGRVTKILEFGAFVEVSSGVEGLVHISELDHRRVNRVEDVLKVDEIVQVKVLKVEKDTRKVSLSIKAMKPAPAAPSGGPGGKKSGPPGKTAEEILKESPAFRRLKAQAQMKVTKFKGGLG
jgi:small subunit ribosomal protein S1